MFDGHLPVTFVIEYGDLRFCLVDVDAHVVVGHGCVLWNLNA
jgi:hypothetical protein